MISTGNAHGIEVSSNIKHYDINKNLTKEIQYGGKEYNNSSIELSLYDETGEVCEQFEIPFRSFVFNFTKMLYQMFSVVVQNRVTTSGNSANYTNVADHQLRLDSGIGNSIYGMQVGTGSANVSGSDYKLQSPIIHGSGSGQLMYGSTQFIPPVDISGSNVWSVQRSFTNSSAQSITVSEVGLVSATTDSTTSTLVLISRDVLDKNGNAISITIGAGQTLTSRINWYIDNSNGLTSNFNRMLYAASAYTSMIYYPWMADSNFVPASSSITIGTTNSSPIFAVIANAGIYRFGIQAGLSSYETASLQSNRLLNPIQHGTGSNQMIYDAVSCDGIVSNDESASFSFSRTITNNSGNSITIKEHALICNGSESSPTQNNATSIGILISKVLPGDQVVADGASINISYTITTRIS